MYISLSIVKIRGPLVGVYSLCQCVSDPSQALRLSSKHHYQLSHLAQNPGIVAFGIGRNLGAESPDLLLPLNPSFPYLSTIFHPHLQLHTLDPFYPKHPAT